jgi:hypothetical protein
MKFNMDRQGYIEAKKWLHKNNLLHCITNGFSVDGFSVIACANEEWDKMYKDDYTDGTTLYKSLKEYIKDKEMSDKLDRLYNKYLLLLGAVE